MKQCPYCKASLEKSARFCIYCMSSLGEENVIEPLPIRRRVPWIVGVAVGLAVLLVVGIVFLMMSSDASSSDGNASSQTATTIAATTTTRSAVSTSNTEKATLPTSSASVSTAPPQEVPGFTASDTASPTHSPTQQTTVTTVSSISPATTKTASRSATTTRASSKTTVTTAATTTGATTAVTGTDTYAYRAATHDDVYLDMTIAVPDDVLVITGIVTPSADGVYRVPNTIDGKRVVAIAPGAFAREDVRVVVLPANVMTVNGRAFLECPNLTDIYYASKAIYTYTDAFAPLAQRSGTLTIHCSWECSNRNFRYYRNIASDWFDAVYQEWNGGDTE